ncbi:MAG TPA: hypothetical protein PLS71_09560 [Leptospiraceae bacterium]|nr:hypothetical protein [Leptospiraceae bacterium]HNB98476.1 hypothetical protein [Leptospiraceae bacterium]HNE09842.1 hypothetical protein [Leptospiraceae bacterium]HNG99443.1 hypothetical protein [Leptospiraceae bacterium]HNI88217.1 hypothetical protein [Leptospiraceae bacterium]
MVSFLNYLLLKKMNLNENIEIKIDFSSLEEIYGENKKDFSLILQKIQQEYTKYLATLEEEIRTENLDEFRKTRHKISATLLLLKLEKFHEYLTFLKEHFAHGFHDKEESIAILKDCFAKTQSLIASKLEDLSSQIH